MKKYAILILFLFSFVNSFATERKDYTDEDLKWMTNAMYHEARGEGDIGMLAIGAVILSRLKSNKFPKTVKGVVLQKNQFSGIHKMKIKDRESWNHAKDLASLMLSDRPPAHEKLDIIRSKEYLYFHVKSMGRHHDCVVLNNHIFYGGNS